MTVAATPTRSAVALRNGVRQASIEMRSVLRGGGILGYLVMPAIMLGFVFFGRNDVLDGTDITFAEYVLPSFLAALLVIGGFTGPASDLMSEREDGSLVRMKSIPDGLRGYVFGKTLSMLLTNLGTLLVAFIPAAILVPQILPDSAAGWIRAGAFIVLGLTASIPIGIAVGSIVRTSMDLVVPMLIVYGLLFISGVFGSAAAMPIWLQGIAKIFPMYWLGLGLRSAFLPAEAAVIEIGGSWPVLEAAAVLSVWSIVGLVLAPILLRRMIRGVSGSSVSDARERVLARGY